MTNDSTRMRIAVATVATAAVVLLVTACGGGGSHSPSVAHVAASAPSGSPSPHSSASGDNVGYSRCMRSHGVPNFPDPDPNSGGAIPKAGAKDLGVDPSQFEAAQQACQSTLPAATGFLDQERQCYQGGVCPPALVQQMLTVGRAFAACMRSHGVSNWPDPTLDDQGRPYFHISAVGITHDQSHSAEMTAKIDACFDASGGGLATG